MSLTFQHAIHVAILLNHSYTWIDSMCIMQDSHEDWKAEASTMKDVYTNSSLNISATSPRSVDKGLFLRPSIDARPLCIEVLPAGAHTRRIEVRSWDYWDHIVGEAPVNRRAWVLQERLLSRRILHFTSNGLAWECCQLTAHEASPSGLSKREPSSSRFKQQAALMQHANDEYAQQVFLEAWLETVHVYSSCHLTEESDKLVALSGVATYFQPFVGGEYLAGLWRNSLLRELLWCTEDDEGRSLGRRPAAYRAPSWSWASVEGPVKYPFSNVLSPQDSPDAELPNTAVGQRAKSLRRDFLSAELVDAAVELEHPAHTTGAVRGGWLRVRARLARPAQWKYFDSSSNFPGPAFRALAPVEDPGGSVKTFGYLQLDAADDELWCEADLYILLVLQEEDWFRGLLLCSLHAELAVSSPQQQFRRIGFFFLRESGESGVRDIFARAREWEITIV